MRTEEVLSRFSNVKPAGDRQWSARCGAHDDQTNSLSIGGLDDGRTLIYCQTGCNIDSVLSSAGLTMRDLFPSSNGNGHVNGSGKPHGKIVAVYDYRDEAGELLFQVCRYESKEFRQRTPTPNGGWAWKLGKARRVLYRLPELLAADASATVFVVEGEKDADRLASLGLIATTNAGGASRGTKSKWLPAYSDSLRGRAVAIFPDNDEPGRDHARAIAASSSGKATSIKIIELPDLPSKGDVSDWLDAGHTVEELWQLVNAAPAWEPTKVAATDDELTILTPRGQTDVANAKRLVAMAGDDIRWCEPWGKWLLWCGSHWRVDERREVDAKAKQAAAELWEQVKKLGCHVDDDGMAAIVRFAKSSSGAKSICNMLALARSDLAVLPASLDTDPWAFNCLNGTIDLRSGELRPHRRDDFLTKLCPVKYDPLAEAPHWEAMLAHLMMDATDMVSFLQRAVGYSMTGSVQEQCLFLCFGKGANGKSTFLNAILDVFGRDYSMQAADGLLMAKRNDSHPTERADLFGKRFISNIEVEEGRRINESLVKALTGGDVIRARRMREDHWEFKPTHKLWMAANHKPTIRGTDLGIWRRMRLVPFLVTIVEGQQDKELPQKLWAEREGILAWAVEGCLAWQRDGLDEPEAVRAATNEYRAEMDVLGAFIVERCIEASTCRSKASELYSAYSQWCHSTGEHAINQRRFGAAMTERGYERYVNNGKWYRGIGVTFTEPTE